MCNLPTSHQQEVLLPEIEIFLSMLYHWIEISVQTNKHACLAILVQRWFQMNEDIL